MRKRGLFVFLFLILGSLVSMRIYSLTRHTPQASAQQAPDPSESVCKSQGKSIDILQYYRPSALNSGGSGPTVSFSGCYVDPQTGKVNTNFTNSVTVEPKPISGEPSDPLPAILAQTGFLINKGAANGDDEWYFFDNSNVYLYSDTSWTNKCENGQQAFYRERNVLSNGATWGGPYQRCLNPDEQVTSTHRYFSYQLSNDTACRTNWGGDVGMADTMTQPLTIKVVQAVDASGNFKPGYEDIAPSYPDTISLEIVGGPGTGEKRFYTRGVGFTGYYAATGGKVTFHARSSPNGASLPTKCDAGAGNTSGEGQQRKPNDFTFWPVEGMPEDVQAKDYKKVADDMVNNGYSAKCVAVFSAGAQFENLDRWIETHKGQTQNFDNIQSQETISAENGSIPFIRSNQESTSQTSSAENYLSVLKGVGQDQYEQMQAPSPLKARMTFAQQMYYAEQNLADRKAACDYYNHDVACPLWEAQPGAVNDLEDTYSYMLQSKLDSRDLAKPYSEVAGKTTLSEELFNAQRDRMNEVPLNMERATDHTYIFLDKELPKDNKSFLEQLFPFLFDAKKELQLITPTSLTSAIIHKDPWCGNDASGIKKCDAVAAIGFPVPAYGIHTSAEHYNIDTWPSWMLKRSLQPDTVNQADQYAYEGVQKSRAVEVTRAHNIDYSSDKRNINPIGANIYDENGGFDTTTRALVDVADAAAGGCQGLVAEGSQNMEFNTKYSESPNFVTSATNFDLFKDLITTGNNPESAITQLASTVYAGLHAGDIRQNDKPYIKVIVVTRYPQDPDPDWGELVKNAYMSQPQLDKLNKDLTDYHLAAAAVGNDPNKIDTVTQDHKILGDVVPYKKDLFMKNFYNWGADKKQFPFDDPDKCQHDSAGNVIPGSCTNYLTISVVADTPGVGMADYGRTLNESTRLWPLFAFPQNSVYSQHARASQNPEQYLQGDVAGNTGGGSGGSLQPPGSSGTKPPAVAVCDGGKRITSGETAVHYCADTHQVCTPTTGQCTVFDSSQNIPAWRNPNDPFISCAQLAPYSACTYPGSLVANKVDAQGHFTDSGTQTACEYVVSQAKAAGISPRLVLALWGEETGFGSTPGPFFGYDPGANDYDLNYQLNGNGSNRPGLLGKLKTDSNYENFLLSYSSSTDLKNRTFCLNPVFPGRVKTYYDYLGPSAR